MAAKSEYRLQALLGLRENAKQKAEQYLGECLRELRDEQERQNKLEQELQTMIADRQARMRSYTEQQMRGEMSAQAIIAANDFIERLVQKEALQRELIDGQKLVVEQKEEACTGAREALVEANQQLKAMEKHKEAWADGVKKEKARQEQDTLDELSQSAFHRPLNN